MHIKRVLITALAVIVAIPVLLALVAGGVVGYIKLQDKTNGVLTSHGQTRRYLVHVPPGYRQGTPTALVISLHGAAGWPAQEMHVSHWDREADKHGFIVVLPAGSDFPLIWHAERSKGFAGDVGFIADLIKRMEVEYSIDPRRIYVDGLSDGGGMAFGLVCELSGQIAAVGMVAATRLIAVKDCHPGRPVPMIAFHGKADPIVPYAGGVNGSAFDPNKVVFPAVRTWTDDWAVKNGCEREPFETAVAADVTRSEYAGCTDGADVVLYMLQNGGHTWPGGEPLPSWLGVGATSNSIDATDLEWQFFSAHPFRSHGP